MSIRAWARSTASGPCAVRAYIAEESAPYTSYSDRPGPSGPLARRFAVNGRVAAVAAFALASIPSTSGRFIGSSIPENGALPDLGLAPAPRQLAPPAIGQRPSRRQGPNFRLSDSLDRQ